VAGYLGAADKPYLDRVLSELRRARLAGECQFLGEVTRAQKTAFLQSLHVLCVPAMYSESKGFYVLEALAAGVPVIQPAHGSFPELIAATGGGLLCKPGNTLALAAALMALMDDEPRRRQLAERGRAAVRQDFTAEGMAAAAWRLYEQVAQAAAGRRAG
jgi:glycosyltransferase involved in cell wall biosynthesis